MKIIFPHVLEIFKIFFKFSLLFHSREEKKSSLYVTENNLFISSNLDACKLNPILI